MGLILTRSPYHVGRKGLDEGATLQVVVGRGATSGGMVSVYATYNLSFRRNNFVDISSLVSPEFTDEYSMTTGVNGTYGNLTNNSFSNRALLVELTFAGSIAGVAQTAITEIHYASEGYLYLTDPHSYDFTNDLHENGSYAGSSDVIYKLDDAPLELSTAYFIDIADNSNSLTDNYISYELYNKGELVDSIIVDSISNLNPFSGLSSDSSIFKTEGYLSRIADEGGVTEESPCLEAFFNQYKLMDIDKVIVSNQFSSKILTVKTVESCKYSPYKLTFKNRFGFNEVLWFFLKSERKLKVTSDTFRANQLEARISSQERAVSNQVRTTQQYNKNGTESIELNSGFVVEALNESFKQLMLSEKVTLYDFDNNVSQAVNVMNGELKYKTVVNDKLINYTINLEMSNNIIDNIS